MVYADQLTTHGEVRITGNMHSLHPTPVFSYQARMVSRETLPSLAV